jgi:excisionase family DNA binding protein
MNTIPPLFENRLYCKKEVAKILNMSTKTIDMMMKRKEIEFLKLGVSVRFNPAYLNKKYGV